MSANQLPLIGREDLEQSWMSIRTDADARRGERELRGQLIAAGAVVLATADLVLGESRE